MNSNRIVTEGWSSEASHQLYQSQWPAEPDVARLYELGDQCGGCSFFAAFNEDWGLCCHKASRHHLETVFEHFTCPSFLKECWGPHSFTTHTEFHCRCGGEALPNE